MTYFNVGKLLIEAQGGESRAKYGNELIKVYAVKLTKEFGNGYNVTGLKRMRQLYLYFPKGAPLGHQLSWSHYREVLPTKDESKRNYYINSCIEHKFSKRQLIEYIKSNAYERLVNKNNIELKYNDDKQNYNLNILDMIKDPLLIKIGKSNERITEKALKRFMIETIEKTMLELGVGFAYVGSEIPIRLNDKIHRPDLVFFNIELNCYVIFEVKLNDLTKMDIGQIEFYIKYYDAGIKRYFHNSTIGITISKRIDSNLVKYNDKDNVKHTTYEFVE